MRDIFKSYKIFFIDPKKSRSPDFYRNMLSYREHVMKKFAGAVKKPREFRCLLCNASKKIFFLTLGKYCLYECEECGLVSPNVKRNLNDEREIYNDPKNIKDTTREIINTYEYRKSIYAPERLAYIVEKTGLTKKKINLLDVGCGPGYFLSFLKERNIQYKGLELTKFLVDICQKKGLNVEKGKLSDEAKGTYSIITLFDVLEHLGEPVKFFKEANRTLQVGGYILAYTPNIHSLSYALMGNRENTLYPHQHLAFFDVKSLNHLAKRTGFVVHTIDYYGLDIMDYFCMKQYEDNYDYLDKLKDVIPLLQAVVDKQNISNHMRVIFKKVKNV